MQGRLGAAAAHIDHGLQIAMRVEYWYAVGFGQRVAARIARWPRPDERVYCRRTAELAAAFGLGER